MSSQIDFGKIPFVQAKWYTAVGKTSDRKPNKIVIHCMEAPEKPDTAENVANYFKKGCPDNGVLRKASAHYCIDNTSIIQCVQCHDVAYGAANANRRGIHLEHAGYSAQSGLQWKDDYSLQMLKNSAMLVGTILIPKFSIQPLWLTDDQIRDPEANGFCTHADVTRAWTSIDPSTGKMYDPTYTGTHTDPGPYFPRNDYMEMIRSVRHGVSL